MFASTTRVGLIQALDRMINIGAYECRHCGNSQEIHPIDLFPSEFSGWSVTCLNCQNRESLPFFPTAPAFFASFILIVCLAAPAASIGETLFGTPMPGLAYMLVVVVLLGIGAASNMVLNFLYYRFFA